MVLAAAALLAIGFVQLPAQAAHNANHNPPGQDNQSLGTTTLQQNGQGAPLVIGAQGTTSTSTNGNNGNNGNSGNSNGVPGDVADLQAQVAVLQQQVSLLQMQVSLLLGLLGGQPPLPPPNGGGNGTTTPPVIPPSMGTVMPTSATMSAGSAIDFVGHNFGHEEDVQVRLSGSVVKTVHADGGGNFSTGSMNVPSSAGTYVYTFTGMMSGIMATSTITVL